MKSFPTTHQPALHGGLRDARSTGAPAQQAPKPRLNDRRSTK